MGLVVKSIHSIHIINSGLKIIRIDILQKAGPAFLFFGNTGLESLFFNFCRYNLTVRRRISFASNLFVCNNLEVVRLSGFKFLHGI